MTDVIINRTVRFRRPIYNIRRSNSNFGFAFIPFLIAAASATAAVGGAVLTLKALSVASPKTVDKIVKSVTPRVVADLKAKGITLPAGQEEQYVKSALISAADQQNSPLSADVTAQLQQTSLPSWLLPMGLGAVALFLVMK